MSKRIHEASILFLGLIFASTPCFGQAGRAELFSVIRDPSDLAVPKMFGAYAKAAGIDASKVTWVVAGSDALPGMLSLGRVDGVDRKSTRLNSSHT